MGPGPFLSVGHHLDLKTYGEPVRERAGPLVRCPRPKKGDSTVEAFWIYSKVITTWEPFHDAPGQI